MAFLGSRLFHLPLTLIFLLAFELPGCELLAGSDWQPISPFTNGTECLAVSPSDPQVVYAGNVYDGVYKSTDGGRTWAAAITGLGDRWVLDLAVHSIDPNIVYAATSSSIDKTTDGGRRWERVNSYIYKPTALAIDPNNPSIVYAGSQDMGLFLSSDAGASWKLSSYPETGVTQIVVDPSDSRVVYAFAHGTYKSSDGGKTWTKLPIEPWPTPQQLGIDPRNNDTLYLGTWEGLRKSTDGGQSWAEIEHFRGSRVWGLVASKSEGAVFASTNGPTYRSDDGGNTWTESTKFRLRRLFPNPDPSARPSIFGTGTGVFLYDGSRWTTAVSGMPPSFDNIGRIQVDAGDPLTLYARQWALSIKSTDGGTTWFELPESPITYYPYPPVADPYRSGVVYRMENVMARSEDGGQHWTELELLGRNLLLAFEPPPSRTVYSYGPRGLFKSTDEGRIWHTIPAPVPASEIDTQRIHVSRDPTHALFVSQGDRVWKSSNGGTSWAEVTVPGSAGPIETDPDDPSTIFLLADHLYRTTDGGTTWTIVFDQARSILTDPQNPKVLYAGIWAEVFRTTDRGETWSRVAPRYDRLYMDALSAAPTGCAILYQSDLAGPFKVYPNRFYFPQVANGVSGNSGIRTSIALSNVLEREAEAEVGFFDRAGEPMAVNLEDGSSASRLRFKIPGKGTVIKETSGTGGLQVGYAQVTASQGVDGTAVFSYSESGLVMSQAGVPAAGPISGFDIAADLAPPARDTGLAIVNTENSQAIVRFDFYDENLKWLKWREFVLPPNGHMAAFVTEIFPGVTLGRGRVKVQSTHYLAAATLLETDHPNAAFPLDVPSLSAFPVVPFPDNTVRRQANYTGYFPQLGDGQSGAISMKTRLVLLGNASDARVTIEFLTDLGGPMSLNLVGIGVRDRHEVALRAGQPLFLETAGSGALQSGYARITSDQPLGGTAVYIYLENRTKLFETGVPLSSADPNLGLIFRSSSDLQTGFALVNAGSKPAEIAVSLYDEAGNLVARLAGATALALPPGGHLARYAPEIFPEISTAGIRKGLIRFDAAEPLSGVVLLQKDDLDLVFPDDVFQLTAFPILRGMPRWND